MSLGDSHPDLARGLDEPGGVLSRAGPRGRGGATVLRAAVILEKARAMALVAEIALSDVLRAELRYTEAKRIGRTTLAQMERAVMRADDPRLLRARSNWARLTAQNATSRETVGGQFTRAFQAGAGGPPYNCRIGYYCLRGRSRLHCHRSRYECARHSALVRVRIGSPRSASLPCW